MTSTTTATGDGLGSLVNSPGQEAAQVAQMLLAARSSEHLHPDRVADSDLRVDQRRPHPCVGGVAGAAHPAPETAEIYLDPDTCGA